MLCFVVVFECVVGTCGGLEIGTVGLAEGGDDVVSVGDGVGFGEGFGIVGVFAFIAAMMALVIESLMDDVIVVIED